MYKRTTRKDLWPKTGGVFSKANLQNHPSQPAGHQHQMLQVKGGKEPQTLCHPRHCLFSLLPSGQCYCCPRAMTERLKRSFYGKCIRLLRNKINEVYSVFIKKKKKKTSKVTACVGEMKTSIFLIYRYEPIYVCIWERITLKKVFNPQIQNGARIATICRPELCLRIIF